MELTVDGLHIHYIDQGNGDTTILLLHGWGVDGSVYHLITDHLSAYCRVIVPDLPGFGQSDEPPQPWTPTDYADFVLHFCTALHITEAVTVGHSNGGRILIELLSRKELSLKATKAILIDAAGIPARHGVSYYLRVGSYKVCKAILKLPVMRSLFPHALEKARSRFGSSDYKKASPVMQRSMVLALKTDMRPRLSHIRASTLLIWGRDDTATPLSDAELMCRAIPDAGLAVLNGGHFAFAESFEHCRRILDSFLQGAPR